MNCVFCCVFYNPEYVYLLFLLLESIYIYGNIQPESYEILIYTTSEFAKKILSSTLYYPKYIRIVINDEYTTIEQACSARYDIFYLPSIQQYDKILYLDTDILVFDKLPQVFDVCQENRLYALEEGELTHEYWGGRLFKEEEKANIAGILGFSSGVLLFPNCEEIKTLFADVRFDIVHRSQYMNCVFDQPYLNYQAYKRGCVLSKMHSYFTTRYEVEKSVANIKHVVHFCGGVGNYPVKFDMMYAFRSVILNDKIVSKITQTKSFIDQYLSHLLLKHPLSIQNALFFIPHTTEYTSQYINKLANISICTMNENVRKVLVVGFHYGLSSLLMLHSQPNLHITCIDTHKQINTTQWNSYQTIQTHFVNRIQFFVGENMSVLLSSLSGDYDLVYLDTALAVANVDSFTWTPLLKPHGIVFMANKETNPIPDTLSACLISPTIPIFTMDNHSVWKYHRTI